MSKRLILPPLPKISDILRIYGVGAKKQLSQNFILDQNITGMYQVHAGTAEVRGGHAPHFLPTIKLLIFEQGAFML